MSVETTAEELALRPSDGVNLAGQDTGRDHLSHSSIGTLLACLRKYELQRVDRLEPIARREGLDLGRAFQRGIELRDPVAGAASLRDGRQSFDQAEEDKLRIQEVTVESAVALYLNRYGQPQDEVREFEYRVRLRSPWTGRPSQTFDLLGYADGLIEAPGWLELIENKFLSKLDPVTIKRLPLDRQIALASYGCWRATGKEVRVVHYRLTRRPSIRQRKNESVDEFCERLAADYRERPDFYLEEQTIFRSSDDLLRIEAELWDWAEQLRQAKRRGFYARNTGHCGEWGGCEFLPICTGDPDAMALYRERERHA